jgi:exodeoxyribonuclease X
VGRISEATFAVADCETTGLDHATDAVVEIGALLVNWRGGAVIPNMALPYFEMLVNPNRPLTPDNSAIHGLIDEDLVGAPYIDEAMEKLARWMPADAVPVAHHLVFDAGFLPILSGGLCTKRLAMKCVPDAPNWKNQTLRYVFKGVARAPHIRALGDAHRAISDATVTAAILPRLLDLCLAAGHPDDIDALIAFAESPILLERVTFGKHKGLLYSEAPTEYLEWMIGNDWRTGKPNMADLDIDRRYTAEHHLRLRRVVAAHA